MKLPNLIIGGVHKAGTTSLFSYLMDHPDICGSSKKEIHHFTPLRYNLPLKDLRTYEQYFSHCPRQVKYLLEASPSYLYGVQQLAYEVFDQLGSPKILFVLREPAERFISYYKHCEGKFLIPRNTTFKKFYETNVKNFSSSDRDDPFYRGLREGNYIDYLRPWIDSYSENVKVVFFEDLSMYPMETMISVCNWLLIDGEFYNNYDFKLVNKTSRYSKKYFHLLARKINMRFEYVLRKSPNLKSVLKRGYSKVNTMPDIEIDPAIKRKLDNFYALKNIELGEYLKKQGYGNLPKWLTDDKLQIN